MATIATTTNATPHIYPSTCLLDREYSTGYLFSMVKASTADNYTVYRSINGGTSWASYSTVVRTSIVEIGSIFIAIDGYLHWCYRTNESSQDRIYYRRMNLATGTWSAEVLVASPGNGGVAGAVHTGIDLHAAETGDRTQIIIAAGYTSGAQHGVILYGVNVTTSTGVQTATNSFLTGTRQWLYTGSGRITPSIDFQHNGDNKHADNIGHIWVAFGRTQLQMVKCSWDGAGGNLVGPTTAVVLASSITAQDFISARYDSTRFISLNAVADTVVMYERNKANTSTTVRTSPVHPTGNIRTCTLSYNSVSGDTRIYAVGTSTAVLYFVDFVRASGTWTSWGTVTADAVLTVTNHGSRKGSYGNAKHSPYHTLSGSPNTLKEDQQALSYAPNTPVWTTVGLAYENGGAADVGISLPLDWVFSDPDTADTQSAYAVSRQIGAGALNYWRASDSTWQVAEVKNVSGSTAITVPSSWGTDGGSAHTYKAKVWDSADLASGYSAGLVLLPSAPVNPAITAPTAAQVLTTDHVTMTWTAAEQTQYRVYLFVQGGAQVYDSGWIAAADLSYLVPYTLANSTAWTLKLQTKNLDGLASALQTRDFSISYTPPATPTLVATPVPASGVITVAITNPAPSGGQPAVASQDLYRRVVGETTSTRIVSGLANNASTDVWQVASGVAYEFQVVTLGVNGTSTTGAWTP